MTISHSQSCEEAVQTLLARLRAGGAAQQSAWAEFFQQFAPELYHWARMQGLDANDADDIVQQSMLQVLRGIRDFRYDPNRGRFSSWMRTIAERKIIDLRRRCAVRKTERSTDNTQPAAKVRNPEEPRDCEWQVQKMLSCLDQIADGISPRRMKAFRLYVLEEVPASEVAQRLEMTVGHVYVVRAQVINKVRERMMALEED
ncbi:MAG: sigma-70 family RNA polymerase sigma factor [Phycisphaerales bacterium]|nr:sigma-70 family RNA polymerase sigma factor [Phycisphaerales bacterium]